MLISISLYHNINISEIKMFHTPSKQFGISQYFWETHKD